MSYTPTPKSKQGRMKHISTDGPYIFVNDRFFETYSYTCDGHKFEIEKKQIKFSDKEEHEFNCYIDNFGKRKPADSFQFHLQPENLYTIDLCEYSQGNKVLAISDIEGNFYALKSILQANHVINNKYDWTYGTNHLVIPGDLIDRGGNVIPCLWLIYKLAIQAKESGGMVHYLLGNHEVMNLSGDFRYVHDKYKYLPKRLDCK